VPTMSAKLHPALIAAIAMGIISPSTTIAAALCEASVLIEVSASFPLSGTVEVVATNQIRIVDFNHAGTAPASHFYLSTLSPPMSPPPGPRVCDETGDCSDRLRQYQNETIGMHTQEAYYRVRSQ